MPRTTLRGLTSLLALLAITGATWAAGETTLTLRNPSGLKQAAWPVTTGVPFPKGALTSAGDVALVDASGRPVPVQTRVTSTWGPKGSVRWLLVDFQPDVSGAKTQAYRLRFGKDVRPAAAKSPLRVVKTADGGFRIDTGAARLAIRKKGFNLFDRVTCAGRTYAGSPETGPYLTDGEGVVYRASVGEPDTLELEEAGPLRAVVCAKGWFRSKAGKPYCRYIVRTHAYAGKPFVKVFYTFLVTEPSGKARFRDIGLMLPANVRDVTFGGVGARRVAPGKSAYLLQYDVDKAVVRDGDAPRVYEATPKIKASTGWFSSDGVTVACRDLPQQFPKELEAVGGKGLVFHAWPAHGVAKPGRKVEDAMLQYLWFCHEGDVLDFTVPKSYWSYTGIHNEYSYRYLRSSKVANCIGLAKTHELLVWFHEPKAQAAVAKAVEAWQEDPVCMADPKWMCASGAFGRIHPYDPKRFPEIERKFSKAWNCERRLERRTRDYGMFNYGDGHTSWDFRRNRWADVYRTWRALHHGAPRVPWLLYVRSGDPKYYRHARRNARHVMDVDVCHFSRPEYEKLRWPQGKIVGALNDYKGIVHWHAGGRWRDYNSMTDFMLYDYYLTGDARGLEVAKEWADGVVKKFEKPHGTRSGAGTCAALVEAYQATQDPKYLKIAKAYVDHFLDRIQCMKPGKPFPKVFTDRYPHLLGKSVPIGAFEQWENYAPWLQRYWDLTGDKRAGKRLAAWGDAYLAGFGEACSLRTIGDYINILAYAYFASGDPKYLSRGLWALQRFVGSIQDTPGSPFDGFAHTGQTSLGFGYMAQRMPALLAALAHCGKPVKPSAPPVPANADFELLFVRTRPKGVKTETVTALVLEEKDIPFRLIAVGAITYKQRDIVARVFTPAGKKIEKVLSVKKGPFRLEVDVPKDGTTGVYKWQIAGTGSFWGVRTPLITKPSRMKVVLPVGGRMIRLRKVRYYFFVPKGVKAFTVASRDLAMRRHGFDIVTPEGKVAATASFAADPKFRELKTRVVVKPGLDGRCWALEGADGFVNLRFTAEGGHIPPCLAVRPVLFFDPGKVK